MKGLKYISEDPRGISLLAYRSYKSIQLDAGSHSTYEFTSKDDTSSAAREYYQQFSELEVVDSQESEVQRESSDTDVSTSTEVEESTSEDPVESSKDDISDEDLKELLYGLDKSTITEAINLLDDSISFGNSRVKTIIDKYYDDYKDILITLI